MTEEKTIVLQVPTLPKKEDRWLAAKKLNGQYYLNEKVGERWNRNLHDGHLRLSNYV